MQIAAHAWSWMDSPYTGIVDQIYSSASQMSSYVRVVRPDEFLMQMRLRLKSTQELTNYRANLNGTLNQLSGMTAPTGDASANLVTAAATWSQASPALISSNPSQAFSYLQQADQQTEVARLSFLSVTTSGSTCILSCPDEASPLYFFSVRETDSTALPVRQYEVQIANNASFSSPVVDTYITSSTYPSPGLGFYIRARAQGDAHGDWGAWSASLLVPVALTRWELE
jgi:hypothetical protein